MYSKRSGASCVPCGVPEDKQQTNGTPPSSLCSSSLSTSPGARLVGAQHGVEPQRHVDGDGRPLGLCQVLAVQHEQRQDVPGPQGGHPGNQVKADDGSWTGASSLFLSALYGERKGGEGGGKMLLQGG